MNYKNPNRAPSISIGGSEDHIMPPSVNESNAEALQGSRHGHRVLRVRRPRHWTCGADGWEAVADYALEWGVARATEAELLARLSRLGR